MVSQLVIVLGALLLERSGLPIPVVVPLLLVWFERRLNSPQSVLPLAFVGGLLIDLFYNVYFGSSSLWLILVLGLMVILRYWLGSRGSSLLLLVSFFAGLGMSLLLFGEVWWWYGLVSGLVALGLRIVVGKGTETTEGVFLRGG